MPQQIRLLIVEDEVLIAMQLEIELKKAGYTVCQRVVTGEEAVTIVQQDSPDIILMDIGLAGDIDGIETTRQIQASTDIPVIFMTGNPDQETMNRAMTLRPAAYFIKPIRMAELTTSIDSACQVV